MYEEILDQTQELLRDEMKDFGGDFGRLEQAVMEMMMSLGKGLLQRLVDSNANGYKRSSILCECNSSMKFVQHRPRDIHTLFGWIRLKRAYYDCRDCGATLVPYDKSSGLGSGRLSPGLAKACCLLAVDNSFAQTSQKIEELFGQKVSERADGKFVYRKLDVNSEASESWHSWSSNSRWIAFSSKRMHGSFTRTYFSYVDVNGVASKPFVLPQKDPGYYERCLRTFSVPELVVEPVWTTKETLGKVVRGKVDKEVDIPISSATIKNKAWQERE